MLKSFMRPPRAALRLCAAVVAAFAAAHVLAQPTSLTLDDALRLAEQRSRQLPAQQASASAARDMAVAASRLPDPALKLGLNNRRAAPSSWTKFPNCPRRCRPSCCGCWKTA